MYIRICVFISLLLLVLTLTVTSCTSEEVDNSSKLDFNVKRLISAYEEGNVEEFAQQNDIKLTEEGVTVIIECEPGSTEKVAQEVERNGAIDVRAQSKNNWVKAVILITKLTDMADISAIRLIRLPWQPVEN